MTKLVRIENADTAHYSVVVEVWEKRGDDQPDQLVLTRELPYPTAMTGAEIYLTSTRYLVVKEAPAKEIPK